MALQDILKELRALRALLEKLHQPVQFIPYYYPVPSQPTNPWLSPAQPTITWGPTTAVPSTIPSNSCEAYD